MATQHMEISDSQWQAISDDFERRTTEQELAAGFVHINLMAELRKYLIESGETHDDNGNPL